MNFSVVVVFIMYMYFTEHFSMQLLWFTLYTVGGDFAVNVSILVFIGYCDNNRLVVLINWLIRCNAIYSLCIFCNIQLLVCNVVCQGLHYLNYFHNVFFNAKNIFNNNDHYLYYSVHHNLTCYVIHVFIMCFCWRATLNEFRFSI